MNLLLKQWLSDGTLLTDGGLGTELQRRGLPVGEAPELWNITHPEEVEAVAASYAQAGSDIILTNTFGANRFTLAKHGAEGQVAQLNRLAVENARRGASTVSRTVRVFGSIGPTGILLMMGQEKPETLFEAFRVQAMALAQAGTDAIVVETMSDPQEAILAVRAAKETTLPVIVSMTFGSGKNKDRTMMGTTPEKAVELLSEAGADAIGSNCGQGIEGFISICQRMKAATNLPIWMKPNAGLPEIVDGKTVYRQTPDAFALRGEELLVAGASFLGGCCGTTPEYIASLRRQIDQNHR